MKSLSVLLALFGLSLGAHALTYDSDVPAAIKTQMIADLDFMAQLQGTKQTPFHQQIYGPLAGSSYKSFFESHVTSVGLNSCGSANAVACVIPFQAPTKMWLTQNFIKFSHPQIARMMVVYHEARHTERQNGNWGHDYCPTPFVDENGKEILSIWTGAVLAGQPACDSTAFGSYGSSTILLKNVGKFCTNCTDKVKMDADMYAVDQLKRIDDPAVKQTMLNDFNVQ
jgi:hypothetical protein